MKKIYCFLLTAVLLFATDCGSEETDENKGTAELPLR